MCCNLLADRLRVFERSPRGRLDDDDEVSLVFVGDEACGHAGKDKISEPQADEKQHDHRQFVFQQVMQQEHGTHG